MNSKGQTATIIFISVVALIALIIGIKLSFTIDWLLITGIGIIALTFIYVIPAAMQGNFDKIKMKFIVVLFLIGALFIGLHYSGLLQQSFVDLSDSYIQVPFYGTVQCKQAVGYPTTSGVISEQAIANNVVVCPVNTKTCDILLTAQKSSFLNTFLKLEYKICSDRAGTTCGATQTILQSSSGIFADYSLATNLPASGSLKYTVSDSWNAISYSPIVSSIKIRYIPYILWVQDSKNGGLNPLSGSTDCKIPSTSSSNLMSYLNDNKILSSTIEDTEGKNSQTGIVLSKDTLSPDDYYNFLSGTVTTMSEGAKIAYNGKQGYCVENVAAGKARVYAIGTIETVYAKYSVVDTQTILGTEDCCTEGLVQLNRQCTNYHWQTINVNPTTGETDVSCSATKPCNDGIYVYADKKTFDYKCISGKCVISDITTVECTTQASCKTDEVCTNYKCMKASTIPGSQPAPANVENNTGVPTCKWYESAYVKESTDNGFLGYKAIFGGATKNTESGCKTNTIIPIVIIGIFVVIIIYILFREPSKSKPKKK